MHSLFYFFRKYFQTYIRDASITKKKKTIIDKAFSNANCSLYFCETNSKHLKDN